MGLRRRLAIFTLSAALGIGEFCYGMHLYENDVIKPVNSRESFINSSKYPGSASWKHFAYGIIGISVAGGALIGVADSLVYRNRRRDSDERRKDSDLEIVKE